MSRISRRLKCSKCNKWMELYEDIYLKAERPSKQNDQKGLYEPSCRDCTIAMRSKGLEKR
ncbi:hypothetical protein UFB30_02350 [Jeotgalibacillus sp. HH7-29]|uniref:Uncharacterized protein n=1 Tax=Jeotgalibacillus haloalkalitolerans TaxID=3104292 RepID=A0ABU5KIP1_9BACL|nr:hypothetical protein [Jeotgalibacillus sp. HH7-29]